MREDPKDGRAIVGPREELLLRRRLRLRFFFDFFFFLWRRRRRPELSEELDVPDEEMEESLEDEEEVSVEESLS